MTKRKAIFIPILISLIVIGFSVYWLLMKSGTGIFFREKITFSEEAVTFSISGGGERFPDFTREGIIEPFRVREGERQAFSIWAIDPKGIKEVIGKIKTDKTEEIIKFNLVEGTKTEGRWVGSWVTKDISLQPSYSIVFRVNNREGEENKMPLYWYAEK